MDNPLALAPKTFDLLVLLVESGGRALSKRELMQALWPDMFVEEANLSFQISTLRKALGEDGPKWIETVPKHGYRFVGLVAQVASNEPPISTKPRSYAWVAAVVLIAAAGVALVMMNSPTRTRGGHPPECEPLDSLPRDPGTPEPLAGR